MSYDTINNDVTIARGAEGTLLVGRYRVVRQLGAGGMGSVWLAEDTQLDNKQFAIKMLPSILVSNKRAYRQLKDEALVAMKLVHPNIVQIRAFEENNGNPFLVMDYIEGQTLDDYLAERGTLSQEETVKLLKPIAAALDYAHGEGVVHRDVKPANVMIRKDGRPFVLDFGIAREIQETMTRVTGKLSSGTLLYMSPEQLNGAPPKKEQDVYSFAAMVYECLKGEPPFVRGQIEYQIVNTQPSPLPQGISSWLSEITMRGLAKKASDRPSTCCEMIGSGSSVGSGGDKKYYTSIAIKAYKLEDYSTAFEAAQKADQDNAEIQYILGRCYQFGDGVEENAEVALRWHYKAAVQGHADSLYELGCMYREITEPGFEFRETNVTEFKHAFKQVFELGVNSEDSRVKHSFADLYVDWVYGRGMSAGYGGLIEVDETTSRLLIKESATGGFSVAQYELGRMYEKGDGVPQDYTSAFKWYRSAAENGNQYPYAQKLGELYKKGLGVARDYDEAIKWYRKAVDESSEIGETVYDLAVMYDIAKNYSEAVKWYRKVAERGMCSAQMRLGALYQKGLGVAKDNKEAFKWYLRAAEHYDEDNAQAQYLVGGFYYSGVGVTQNFSEAVKWYRKAAERGIADAQRSLGVMYAEGKGVEKDYEEALTWYRKAVNQGHSEAYFNLAEMYEYGHGVEKNAQKAFELYIKSAELGYVTAQVSVANSYKTGRLLLSKEYCCDINLCERVKWLRKAVEQGRYYSLLADCYFVGEGVPVDYAEAAKWYRKDAEKGLARAQEYLATLLFTGKGVDKDVGRAVMWYRKAAEQGRDFAQYQLGLAYEKGTGVEKDSVEAARWYLKAAEQGHVKAQLSIGNCLNYGRGVTSDQSEAFKWYFKAAEQGNSEAQYEIGIMLFCGNGVMRDQIKAEDWIRKSAEQGNVKAQHCLGKWYANWTDMEDISIPRDYAESFKWYRKAAEQGDEVAQYFLGEMYYKGLGVAQNFGEALKVFRKFADKRFDARFRLGLMYRNGEGVAQNYDEAIKLLQEAARGWGDASYELGVMYEDGIGVQKNLADAIYWYRNAAEGGHEKASAKIEKMTADAYGANDVANEVEQHYEDVLTLPGGQRMEMIYCPPGEFLMGSPLIEELRSLNEVQHKVILTKGFWLGKYPVTQEQWISVMGSNPSYYKGVKCPVDNVSWNDCHEFINRLNHLIGCQVRLPTEAEWEYACRAGTRTMFYWGNVFDGSQASCWGLYGSSSRVCDVPKVSTPVDRYASNAWGFYDMSGNMGEWCEDWYSDYNGITTDPIGPRTGEQKVFRGGCIVYQVEKCRSASRDSLSPDRRDFVGFRLCCTAE